jgi:hypothetical protein
MKPHQHQFSVSGQRTLDASLGRLVMRVLLRVAVTLLIAIPLFLVVATAFALDALGSSAGSGPRADDIHSRETQHLRAAD